MTIKTTLDGNTFEAEDTAVTPELVSMFRSWLNAQSLEPAVTIEELTERLQSNNNTLHDAVVGLSGPAPTGEQ